MHLIVTPGRSCAVILERWLVWGARALSGVAHRDRSDWPRTAQIVGPGPGVMERQVWARFWVAFCFLAGRWPWPILAERSKQASATRSIEQLHKPVGSRARTRGMRAAHGTAVWSPACIFHVTLATPSPVLVT